MSAYLGNQRFEGPCRRCGTKMIRFWGNIQVCDPCLEEWRKPPPPKVSLYRLIMRRLRRMK